MKIKKSEKDTQRQIIDYLKLTGWSVYRTNNAATWNAKCQAYIWHGKKGYPDITAIKGKILMYVEVKSSVGKLSTDQAEFQKLISEVDQVMAVTARSLDDILAKISAN